MACDIHIHVEVKPEGNTEWTSGDIYTMMNGTPRRVELKAGARNYHLFSILADVRNYGYVQPTCQPRGVPDDLSKELFVELMGWGEDAHSTSYFTLNELIAELPNYKDHESFVELVDELKERYNLLFYEGYQYKTSYSELGDNLRIVFWFDN